MNILLAIDRSADSGVALNALLGRPHAPGTGISVLTVVPASHPHRDPPPARELEMQADNLVHAAAERLRQRGIDATPLVLHGEPKAAILDFAVKMGADFVFLGAHGETALPHFLLGSVARTVMRFAPCSVGLIRPASPHAAVGGMKILLATDGSEFSRFAAQSIAARSWPDGTQVRIVSVVETPPTEAEPYTAAFGALLSDNAVKSTRAAAETAADTLAGHGLNATIHDQLFGAPKQAILDTASHWQADLIVAGAHGHSGISRFLFGSVSEAVAMHADCSVELIRPKIIH